MEVWIKQGRKKLRIPVLPGEVTVSGAQNNTEVNVNALGTINLLGKRGLERLGFSSFFPARYESYCEYSNIMDPEEYCDMLEKMKRNGIVKVHFGNILSMKATIESFEHSEKDGSGDRYYTVDFKEHRNISIPASVIVLPVTTLPSPTPVVEAETRDTSSQAVPSMYEVKQGDTLSAIARKFGLSGYSALYEANKGIIGGNPNKIEIGMQLTIPSA